MQLLPRLTHWQMTPEGELKLVAIDRSESHMHLTDTRANA